MLTAFHSAWTKPFFSHNPGMNYEVEPFDLLSTALSALVWQKQNGSIRMICDSAAAAYYKALGLSFLWNDGIHPLLDAMPEDINPSAFWAAGKIYALQSTSVPCVMLDTDFICWQPIASLVQNMPVAAIHTEEISDDIYPGPQAFSKSSLPLDSYDWSVLPVNTALCYFGDTAFKEQYTTDSIAFLRSAPMADNALTYMVFAEQRMLAMCAAKYRVALQTLSSLDELFSGKQTMFTHIWGFKQQMRDDPVLQLDFCRRCAARLRTEFPPEAEKLRSISALHPYFL